MRDCRNLHDMVIGVVVVQRTVDGNCEMGLLVRDSNSKEKNDWY